MEALKQFLIDDKLRKIKIAVVGDCLLDEYYYVDANRVSPEFPIPIMKSEDHYPCQVFPGGAANVCFQFSDFNVDLKYYGIINPYAYDVLKNRNILTDYCEKYDCKVPIKRRLYQGQFPLCRWDIEDNHYGINQTELIELRNSLLKRYVDNDPPDVLIISDYNKGLLDGENAQKWVMAHDTIIIVDPKKGPLSKWKGCTVFKPNLNEIQELTGLSDYKSQIDYLLEQLKCDAIVNTRGGDGIWGVVNGDHFKYSRKVSNGILGGYSGAGDCFCAFLSMALGRCIDIKKAVELAFEAGAIYVQKKHNMPVTKNEFIKRFDPISSKIKTREELAVTCEDLRKECKNIGFTSGAFDIFHAGHADYLQKAKSKCDVLVIGLNSDKSVKEYKGDSRPIISENERLKVVAALECVDYVFLFDERRNKDNIEILKPKYYIKAGDYKESELTSSVYLKPWGGETIIIPSVTDLSTTKIIEKITCPDNPESCRVIFLDRDGTLMENVPFLDDLEKVKLLPGVENLKKLQDIGYKLVIITNQQGIGLGYFPKEDFYEVNSRLFSLLSAHGLKISKVYYCPHSEADECDCRKPRTGMFKRAKKEMNVDFSKSYMIGDRGTDMKAAKLAGVKGLLLKNNWEEIVNKIYNENK